jgi:hypothetical protein
MPAKDEEARSLAWMHSIQFGPSPASGLNFSSIIVEVTPEEFQKIQDREWTLPNGWEVAELIPRSDDRAAR